MESVRSTQSVPEVDHHAVRTMLAFAHECLAAHGKARRHNEIEPIDLPLPTLQQLAHTLATIDGSLLAHEKDHRHSPEFLSLSSEGKQGGERHTPLPMTECPQAATNVAQDSVNDETIRAGTPEDACLPLNGFSVLPEKQSSSCQSSPDSDLNVHVARASGHNKPANRWKHWSKLTRKPTSLDLVYASFLASLTMLSADHPSMMTSTLRGTCATNSGCVLPRMVSFTLAPSASILVPHTRCEPVRNCILSATNPLLWQRFYRWASHAASMCKRCRPDACTSCPAPGFNVQKMRAG
jgi:hypothetical protein